MWYVDFPINEITRENWLSDFCGNIVITNKNNAAEYGIIKKW